MLALPQFITFTGYDDGAANPRTIDRLIGIAKTYPVEYGILHSIARAGRPRYPSQDAIGMLVQNGYTYLRLAAHLCGQYAEDALNGRIRVVGTYYSRYQVNVPKFPERTQILSAAAACHMRKADLILQWRDVLWPPEKPGQPLDNVSLLVDASGGEGKSVLEWDFPAPASFWPPAGIAARPATVKSDQLSACDTLPLLTVFGCVLETSER
jgi:hypothetical protein